MARTNIDIDDDACREVMRRYHLATKREAVNFALRRLAGESLDLADARARRDRDGMATSTRWEPSRWASTDVDDWRYRS